MLKFIPITICFFVAVSVFFILNLFYPISYWYLSLILFLFLSIQFLGAYFIQLNFHVTSLNSLSTQEKKVVLTFDDGPHNPNTTRVLEVLKKHDVKALFCIIGKNCLGNEPILKQIIEEGHSIANHSYEHAFWFDIWSTKKVIQDITACQKIIESYQPHSKWFRPPYGVTNPNIAKALKTLGLQSVGWHIRSYDTSIKESHKINQRVLSQLKPGAIILLHDRLDVMPELLETLIPEIRNRGYAFSLI